MNRKIKRPENYEALLECVAISQSGYGGILYNGNIVDRRQYPLAIPLQKNTLFGTPEPKETQP